MSVAFSFTPEQADLRSMVREFCERAAPESQVREWMAGPAGYDPAVWSRLGGELGILGIGIPEDSGGSGGGAVERAIVAEEFGRVLMCGPVVGSMMLASTALSLLKNEAARKEYLPGLLSGQRYAAFAVPVHRGVFDPAAVTVAAEPEGRTATLTGSVAHVIDAPGAGLLLVAARDGAGVALYTVAAGAPGLVIEPVSTMDLTRRQAAVRFDATPARLLAAADETAGVCDRVLRIATVLLAAEQVGAAQHVLDTSVGYAKTRMQFGRAIGSFQAVKHLCANMLIDVELARSTALHAAWSLDEGTDEDQRIEASLAKAVCSDAFTQVAATTIQVHGGIGFTWEHQAHLYYKRAVTDAALLGSATDHRERLAELVLD
jgi:alkylation response protein AidB-like acyl-CoA dehydrogenase